MAHLPRSSQDLITHDYKTTLLLLVVLVLVLLFLLSVISIIIMKDGWMDGWEFNDLTGQ